MGKMTWKIFYTKKIKIVEESAYVPKILVELNSDSKRKVLPEVVKTVAKDTAMEGWYVILKQSMCTPICLTCHWKIGGIFICFVLSFWNLE